MIVREVGLLGLDLEMEEDKMHQAKHRPKSCLNLYLENTVIAQGGR